MILLDIVFWCSICFILYVYFGYPILVTVFSRIRQRELGSLSQLPSVTLLFAAHNEEKSMRQKIDNSLALDYPRELLDILIVDDGSVDRTSEIARSISAHGVRVISFPERRGKMMAINEAMGAALGEIVLFSDSDNYYPPDVVRVVIKHFADPMVGGVSGGRNVVGESYLGAAEGLYWKYEEFIKLQESRLNSCVGVAGDLLAIRRKLYTAPPPSIINDDFYIALSVIKQGYRVVYAPEARSYHPVASTEKGEIERRARMVAGRYQTMFSAWRMLPFHRPVVLWQIISHKYLRPFVPFAMILALLSNVAAVIVSGASSSSSGLALSGALAYYTLTLQLFFYLLALFGRRYKMRGLFGKLIYVPTFLLNSNLAALIGFYRYFGRKQTVIWKKVREDT